MFAVGFETEPPREKPRQLFLSEQLALLDRYQLQGKLVGALGKTENHTHLVPRAAACHRSYRHWRCEKNHNWAEAENSCSLRVCPHCARRRALILAGRIENFLGDRILGLRYVVLSMKNNANCEQGYQELMEAWGRLRRLRAWKRKVVGCIIATEVTRNKEDGTWHWHLNLLIEGDYFPQPEMRQMWIQATRGKGQQVWIGLANRGTVRELVKYVTKLSDLVDDPQSLDSFLDTIQGARLIRTYGTFFGLKVDDAEEEEVGRCPDCGPDVHVKVKRLGPIEPHQLCLDSRGVFRITGDVIPRPESEPVRPRAVTAAQRAMDRLFQPFVERHRKQNRGSWKEYIGAAN